MNASFTPHFQRSYQKLPKEIQAAFDKQLVLLLQNLRHPSLRAKKYDEGRDVWQVRVTGNYRCYFEIQDNQYTFHEIRAHGD
jgi:mRNA-degrading endonuclease RelE of RelBE toxin-antitoxin system